MSKTHPYQRTYVSETDAKTIARRAKALNTEKSRQTIKARSGINDYLEARELDMTVQDYREFILPKNNDEEK
jgi:hypothetical protein